MRVSWVALLALVQVTSSVLAVPLVYTGLAVTFEKEPFAEPTQPENQDVILSDVRITRASTQGIYNAAREASYMTSLSPVGTEWAFPNNNPGASLTAAECTDGCPEFVFQNWETSLGGAGSLATAILEGDAVLHLIDQDIYLDIRFTSWGQGFSSGGTFSLERAAITPSADFDRDGDVDGRDFLTWQRNYGLTDALQTEGDADFDGIVTSADLGVWQDSYGGAPLAINLVPEPCATVLVGIFALTVTIQRR